ncbi:hypothetical protein QM012_003066 [Aureobasidium pullulans]|uniref:BZIP domain-containing protein n=1 Tax=Aureobasidium pullulans TaxID=5580 RepID=A0ABR0T970_AURPU
MCCKPRTSTQALNVAKLVQDQPSATTGAAHNEPLGPPPAYEQFENEPQSINSSNVINAPDFLDSQVPSNVRAVPSYSFNNANLESTPNNTTTYTPRSKCQSRCASKRAAKYERKQQKREYRQENRLEKREYRQEKRELRAEHRFERKEMRRAHGGPISMLIKGVSNLMK